MQVCQVLQVTTLLIGQVHFTVFHWKGIEYNDNKTTNQPKLKQFFFNIIVNNFV
jgi:hypothetical protein